MMQTDQDVYELWDQYVTAYAATSDNIELARTALVVAKTAYPNLAIEYQLSRLNGLAAGVAGALERETDPLAALNTLSQYLFEEAGFRGNEADYYDPRNSYLSDVLTRRLGIPITLALVYIEVGQRAGLPLVGVGLPGHFLVGHREVPDLYVDTFHGGTLLTAEECRARFHALTSPDTPWTSEYLTPVTPRAFIGRLMRNLKQIYLSERELDRALTVQTLLTRLHPDDPDQLRDRGLILAQLGEYQEALPDLRAYLQGQPQAADRLQIEELVRHLATQLEE